MLSFWLFIICSLVYPFSYFNEFFSEFISLINSVMFEYSLLFIVNFTIDSFHLEIH